MPRGEPSARNCSMTGAAPMLPAERPVGAGEDVLAEQPEVRILAVEQVVDLREQSHARRQPVFGVEVDDEVARDGAGAIGIVLVAARVLARCGDERRPDREARCRVPVDAQLGAVDRNARDAIAGVHGDRAVAVGLRVCRARRLERRAEARVERVVANRDGEWIRAKRRRELDTLPPGATDVPEVAGVRRTGAARDEREIVAQFGPVDRGRPIAHGPRAARTGFDRRRTTIASGGSARNWLGSLQGAVGSAHVSSMGVGARMPSL